MEFSLLVVPLVFRRLIDPAPGRRRRVRGTTRLVGVPAVGSFSRRPSGRSCYPLVTRDNRSGSPTSRGLMPQVASVGAMAQGGAKDPRL